MVTCFDSSSTDRGSGAEAVLYAPDGTNISLSYKLEFPYSNYEAEYKVVIIGLIYALQMEFADSGCKKTPGNIKHDNRELELKKCCLV